MKKLFENWRKYVNEQAYLIQNAVDHESNFYENMEEGKDLESKIRAVIDKAGGAADMETLKKYIPGATEEEIKSAMGDWAGVEGSPETGSGPGEGRVIGPGVAAQYIDES